MNKTNIHYPAKLTVTSDNTTIELLDFDIICSDKTFDGAYELVLANLYQQLINIPDDDLPPATDLLKAKFGLKDNETLIIISQLHSHYRKEKKLVRKNVSIPAWLNDLGIRHNINFSQVLTEALIYVLVKKH